LNLFRVIRVIRGPCIFIFACGKVLFRVNNNFSICSHEHEELQGDTVDDGQVSLGNFVQNFVLLAATSIRCHLCVFQNTTSINQTDFTVNDYLCKKAVLKILVVSNYSGISSSRPEAELMLGLARKGVSITIMTPGKAEYVPAFEQAGIRVIDFQPRKKFDRNEISFMRQELMDGDYDVVHLFNGKAIINGLKAAKGLRTKVVLYRGYCGHIHWWDPTAYFKFLHPRADAIWCIAPAVADLINRNILFGRKKAFCIAKGHDPHWYENIEATPLHEFNLPPDAFVVSMVANARRMKGIKYLIRSTFYIDSTLPVYILLIGRGLDSPDIKKLVEKSPLRNRIIFTGYRPDANGLVKNSDVFVLSSIFGEAICKSVIEAMSLGVAPVITDIPGNRGLVENFESGLVIPRKDPEAIARSVERLYRAPDERINMAVAAQERIKSHYHIQDTIEKMFAFYQKLTETGVVK